MKVFLQDVKNNKSEEAIIEKANGTDMPLKKDGWQFTWRKLFQIEGALFYKLFTIENPDVVEGVIMLTLIGLTH